MSSKSPHYRRFFALLCEIAISVGAIRLSTPRETRSWRDRERRRPSNTCGESFLLASSRICTIVRRENSKVSTRESIGIRRSLRPVRLRRRWIESIVRSDCERCRRIWPSRIPSPWSNVVECIPFPPSSRPCRSIRLSRPSRGRRIPPTRTTSTSVVFCLAKTSNERTRETFTRNWNYNKSRDEDEEILWSMLKIIDRMVMSIVQRLGSRERKRSTLSSRWISVFSLKDFFVYRKVKKRRERTKKERVSLLRCWRRGKVASISQSDQCRSYIWSDRSRIGRIQRLEGGKMVGRLSRWIDVRWWRRRWCWDGELDGSLEQKQTRFEHKMILQTIVFNLEEIFQQFTHLCCEISICNVPFLSLSRSMPTTSVDEMERGHVAERERQSEAEKAREIFFFSLHRTSEKKHRRRWCCLCCGREISFSFAPVSQGFFPLLPLREKCRRMFSFPLIARHSLCASRCCSERKLRFEKPALFWFWPKSLVNCLTSTIWDAILLSSSLEDDGQWLISRDSSYWMLNESNVSKNLFPGEK